MSQEYVTGVTRGGASWVPAFIVSLNQRNCIGCGRCFKVCPRKVFDLVEREVEEDDDDDGFSDDTAMVMTIADATDCIGCQACSRVCPKKCHEHAPASIA